MLKIYLIAGEASGDNIGAKLMKALRTQRTDIEFYGIGGEKMLEQKMNLLFPSQELSVMGFLEIIPYIPKFLKLIKQTIEDIIKIQPDMVVTIDSPGFSFRVAKAIKNKFAGKLIHYIAPTVWAYKPGRAKKIASIYDHLLVILPFEPKYFVKEGLATSYVGHPAIEDLENKDNKLFREKYRIPKDDLLLCLAPGSRKQEIQTLLPIFLEAVYYLSKKITQKITIVIPSKSYLKSIITSYISASNLNVILIEDSEKQDIFSASDLALSKSGTITTELAFYKMPMVIAHRVNQISYWLLRKMIKVKYATIVNILADKELIPELLQEKCNPVTIGEELYKAFLPQNRNQWEKELQIQLDKLQVGKEIPSQLAAKEILALFN